MSRTAFRCRLAPAGAEPLDSTINAAARALSAGDPLGALRLVALREDAHGLALRGVAMAQLGELQRARELLRSAAEQFEAGHGLAHARCVVAAAEVSLALRELSNPEPGLEAAIETLREGGDLANLCHAQVLLARRLLLSGQPREASELLQALDMQGASAMLVGLVELMRAELNIRSVRIAAADENLMRAAAAAHASGIPALRAEVEAARARLATPALRVLQGSQQQLLPWRDVESLLEGDDFVVNACRRSLDVAGQTLNLARRPVLFALLRALAEAHPDPAPRDELILQVFEARLANETLRARLRVEVSRLRALLKDSAELSATSDGFVLHPRDDRAVLCLAPADDSQASALKALLGDGAAWSTSALAVALGTSQRSVQRALVELEAAGELRSLGRGRAQRWVATAACGYATVLLLPVKVATG